MANPNIVGVTDIRGGTATLALTTSAQAIVNNPASSGKVIKINSLYVANVDGSDPYGVTVSLYSQDDLEGSPTKLADVIPVPVGATLVVISKDAPIYLTEDKSVGILAGVGNTLEAICSYEEIS